MHLHNRNVVYVGGFGGIGYASCRELLIHPIKALVIMEHREDRNKLKNLQKEFPHSSIHYIEMDITDKACIVAAFRTAKALLTNSIDVVVNGSGVYNDQDPELSIHVNLLGLINTNLIVYKHMDRSSGGQGGLIVNISSVTGLVPNPLMAIYSATKSGIISFTRALANDLYFERSGISFITFCPGGTTTDLIAEPVEKSTFNFVNDLHRNKNATSLKQTPEECAKCLVQLIENGCNGSVWVCDLGKLEEIHMPDLWKRRDQLR